MTLPRRILESIVGIDPKCRNIGKILAKSWDLARFSPDFVGATNDPRALGRALLRIGKITNGELPECPELRDLYHCRSGLLDTHRVLFDFDDIVTSLSNSELEMRDHLRWMIDSRRNAATISLILKALKNTKSVNGELSGLSPEVVGRQLNEHLKNPDESVIVKKLIEGNLHEIPNLVEKTKCCSNKLQKTIRKMHVYWCLLDMQIMTTRLFHAEWNAYEKGGMFDPENVTVASFRNMLQELIKKAEQLEQSFKRGEDGADLDAKLLDFIEENGLEDIARRHAEFMKTDPDSPLSKSERRKLLRFMNELKRRVQRMDADLQKILEDRVRHHDMARISRDNDSRDKNKTGGEKRKHDIHARDNCKGILEANASVSTIRFNLTTQTGLLYLSHRVLSAMNKIPKDERILTNYGPDSLDHQYFSDVELRRIRDDIAGIYRALYIRDQRLNPHIYEVEDKLTPQDPLLSPQDCDRLDPEMAVKFGAQASPEEMVASHLGFSSSKVADVAPINRYRLAHPKDPQVEYLDWLFESSLWARLDGSIVQPRARRLTA
ncbi:hypothetical protein WJT74_01170 [Sphingomicrobium sp. XHP0239]|uniref:hypothetical protein n=1 Tax=Sphingomicrobium maritimum TaxID=3133972 RepID=UPI0031CC900A